MIAEILSGVTIGLVVIILYFVIKKLKNQESMMGRMIDDSMRKFGLDEKIGEIKAYNESIKSDYAIFMSNLQSQVGKIEMFASDVRKDYQSLDRMLQVPQQRGALGEIALERILSDQLPKTMFGIRQKINGKNPDAHIVSISGIICIDSKFPLDNYKKMLESTTDDERETSKKLFMKNINDHFQKIKDDYVHPELGTTEFAFAYIPSESIYWFLINECYDALNEWSVKGVQVVSPLTMSAKISLIKAGVHAKKLSEEAKIVVEKLGKLKVSFEGVDGKWKTFFNTHLKNLIKKASEVETSYQGLRADFDTIQRLE
jgi:DNA recombination protein RmuC